MNSRRGDITELKDTQFTRTPERVCRSSVTGLPAQGRQLGILPVCKLGPVVSLLNRQVPSREPMRVEIGGHRSPVTDYLQSA